MSTPGSLALQDKTAASRSLLFHSRSKPQGWELAVSAMAAKGGSSHWELSLSLLPNDTALIIASFLEASDVCSLGSCSRSWRALCASDSIWIALFKKRWPSPDGSSEIPTTSGPQIRGGEHLSSPAQGWRDFYISKHKEIASYASSVVKFVEQYSQDGSLDAANYLNAIACLCQRKLGFKDVQLFFLARKHRVLLNLIGMHYCMLSLRIPTDYVLEALHSCQVTERQVCVSWVTLDRWYFGYHMPEGYWSRKISLGELAMNQEEEVLSVFNLSGDDEVLTMQITPVTATAAYPC